MNLNNFIKDTYGSGIRLNFKQIMIVLFSCITISVLMFCNIDPSAVKNELPIFINNFFLYYVELFILCFGFTFLALYFYCKPIPPKDRFKSLKIIFAFILLLILGVLFLPYIVIRIITNGSGEILKIKNLFSNIIETLITIIIWIFSFYIILAFLCGMGDILRVLLKLKYPVIHNIVGVKAVIYYSMFLSMILSNKIAEVSYFKINGIKDPELKKQIRHEMKLFWYYMVFFVSFIAKPLDFNDTILKLFFDALFYSSATIALLSKVIEWRNKA